MNTPATVLRPERLVDGNRLLEVLFESGNRPCLRWLGYQRSRRMIPYFKIGRLVRYDPMLVRDALERKCLIALRQNDH